MKSNFTQADATVSSSQRTVFEVVLLIGGSAMLLVLLYLIRDFLTPPLIALTGALLLWPLRRQSVVHAIYLAGGLLFFLWVFYTLSAVLIPFILIYLLAFLFHPVLDHFQTAYRVPRWSSSFFITALVVGVIALFGLFLIPNLYQELDLLAVRILEGLTEVRMWMLGTSFFDRFGWMGVDNQDLALQLTQTVQEYLTLWMQSMPSTLNSLIGSIPSLLGIITMLVLIPVVLFYMMKDFELIHPAFVALLPSFRGSRRYQAEAGWILGNYLRGQLTISAIATICVTVALLLVDMPFALIIGILAGVLNMIPSLGAILTNILAVCLVIILGERGLVDVVLVMSILLAQNLFEQAILVPKILSQRVGLHPIAILFSLLIFGYFMGIIGLFVAVPFTALVHVMYTTSQSSFEWDLVGYLERDIPALETRDLEEKDLKTALENPTKTQDVTFPIN